SYAARLIDVIAEIQIHAVFGLILLLSSTPLFVAFTNPTIGWPIDPLRDQAIAGTLAWTYAELPLLIVLIVTLSRWRSRDLTLADRRRDQDDAEREEYNAYLATLSQHDR
ncbi:cytochrome c oxidase assembly protein, partial [Salmonella enterica subsp. enterica serovar Haifa]|nr:cytochrome c oxidase assembly protein [Salmonella enterica subsp. enterica serovar Haifa]